MATCSGTAILGNYFAVSLKMKHSDINDPEIPVLGIYLRKVKTYVHTKTCMWMVIETLLIISKKTRNNQTTMNE